MMWNNKFVALCLCVVLLVLNSCSKDEYDYNSISGTWAYVYNPVADWNPGWVVFEDPPIRVQCYYNKYYKVFLSNERVREYEIDLDGSMSVIDYFYSEKKCKIVDNVICFPDEGTSCEIKNYLNNYYKVKDVNWEEMPTIEDYSISNIEKILPHEW